MDQQKTSVEAISHGGPGRCPMCVPCSNVEGWKSYQCSGNVIVENGPKKFSLPINAALTVLDHTEDPTLLVLRKAAEKIGWYGPDTRVKAQKPVVRVVQALPAQPTVAVPVPEVPAKRLQPIQAPMAEIMSVKVKEPVPEVALLGYQVKVKKRPQEIEVFEKGISIALASWGKDGVKEGTVIGSEELLKLALAKFLKLDVKEFDL